MRLLNCAIVFVLIALPVRADDRDDWQPFAPVVSIPPHYSAPASYGGHAQTASYASRIESQAPASQFQGIPPPAAGQYQGFRRPPQERREAKRYVHIRTAYVSRRGSSNRQIARDECGVQNRYRWRWFDRVICNQRFAGGYYRKG